MKPNEIQLYVQGIPYFSTTIDPQGCTKGQKSGGAGSNAGRWRGAAAARRRLLICQNRVGQLPHLPLPLVHPWTIV